MPDLNVIDATQPLTICQIKRHTFYFQQNLQNSASIPKFWIEDWLSFVLDRPKIFLISHDDYALTEAEKTRFFDGVTKMQQGMPLAYLLGYQEFWSLKFFVNVHTLIPRPETEILLEQALIWLDRTPHLSRPVQILDLGTGSGCIAISLAHELAKRKRSYQILAIDKSLPALEMAKKNAQFNQVDHIQFLQSDWFSELKNHPKFDLILANPPYIDKNDTHLQQLTAEPLSALVADNQGMADIEAILDASKNYLTNGALLAIEHGFLQAQAVQNAFLVQKIQPDLPAFDKVQTVKDYGGQDRVTLGIFSGTRF